jgi:hypothetical protein
MNKKIMPVLYSLPVVEKLDIPPRVDVLSKIESGELEYIDFRANVFTNGMNRNPYRFREEDLAAFAMSFEGQPFLRDHDTEEIESRDGMVLSSAYDGTAFVQDIRLSTRRGMLDYIEGRIDRFSIGWFYDDCICSICQSSFFSSACSHWPGMKYQTLAGEVACELIFVNPVGKEVSAVNVPAVEGTGIIAQLSAYKGDFLGQELAELKAKALVGDQSQTEDSGQTVTFTLTNTLYKPNNGQEPVKSEVDAVQAQRESFKARLDEAVIKKFQGVPMNSLRELMSERAQLLAQAQSITEAADAEGRDLNESERETFTAILGFGDDQGKVGELDAQIARIEGERAKLKAALEKLPEQKAEKPTVEVAAESKLMKRGDFDALSAKERSAFIRNGGRLED